MAWLAIQSSWWVLVHLQVYELHPQIKLFWQERYRPVVNVHATYWFLNPHTFRSQCQRKNTATHYIVEHWRCKEHNKWKSHSESVLICCHNEQTHTLDWRLKYSVARKQTKFIKRWQQGSQDKIRTFRTCDAKNQDHYNTISRLEQLC